MLTVHNGRSSMNSDHPRQMYACWCAPYCMSASIGILVDRFPSCLHTELKRQPLLVPIFLNAVSPHPGMSPAKQLLLALFHDQSKLQQYSGSPSGAPYPQGGQPGHQATTAAAGPSSIHVKAGKGAKCKAGPQQACAPALTVLSDATAAGYTVRQISRAARRGLDQVRCRMLCSCSEW